MGDLDEAIREHLELKRRRGADPAEVAREEQEALSPVTRSHAIIAPEALQHEGDEHAEPLANGDAPTGDEVSEHSPPVEDLGDATQEFRVVHDADDWLEDDEG